MEIYHQRTAAAIGVFTAGEGKLVVKGGVLAVEGGDKWFSHTVTDANGDTIVYANYHSTKEGVQAGEKSIISPENEKYVDILSPEAKQHILYGDKPGSGGHLHPGKEGKTVFPESWSADKVVHEIGDITTSPNTKWYAQSGTGGIYTKAGQPARWAAYEVRDGVRIRVIYEPATSKVITAFPDSGKIPPNYKSITK